MSYEFEQAVVELGNADNRLIAHFNDGSLKNYGIPDENDANKIWQAVDSVRTGAPMACGVDAASAQTLCINGAQESVNEITQFPKSLINQTWNEVDMLTWVNGLQEIMEACYENGILPSEDPTVEWARKGRIIDVRDYHSYPSK